MTNMTYSQSDVTHLNRKNTEDLDLIKQEGEQSFLIKTSDKDESVVMVEN